MEEENSGGAAPVETDDEDGIQEEMMRIWDEMATEQPGMGAASIVLLGLGLLLETQRHHVTRLRGGNEGVSGCLGQLMCKRRSVRNGRRARGGS